MTNQPIPIILEASQAVCARMWEEIDSDPTMNNYNQWMRVIWKLFGMLQVASELGDTRSFDWLLKKINEAIDRQAATAGPFGK